MVRLVLSALLVGYLPGALVFRLPLANRDARAALDADERVFWHVIISVVWSVTVVLALTSVEAYRFERLLAVNGIVALLIVLTCRQRLRYATGSARAVSASALLPIAVCGLGAWLFFPPSEYVMGGKDPGSYMNEGIQMAQRGTLRIHDPIVADVPEPLSILFFPPHYSPDHFSSRFMGFFVVDRASGDVIGQFPHFLPASIAIGYGLNGLSGARQTTPIWALLGLAAIYFVGARLVGRAGAAAAAALVAINVIDVWFARQPNSEQVMQAMLFAGMLAFTHATGIQRFFAPLAGVLIGLQMFMRYEIVLVIGAFAAAWACLGAERRRVGWGFWLTLVPLVALGLLYLSGPLRAYGAYPLNVTRDHGGWTLVAGAVLAVAAGRWMASREAIAPLVRRWLPRVLALVLVALAVYAWFLRQPGGGTTDFDADSLRHFAWYLTTWGVWAGVLGLAMLIWRRFWIDPAFVLASASIGGFFFYKTRIPPEHFYSMRRFLAAALPAMLIGVVALAATAAAAIFNRAPRGEGGAPAWRSIAAGALTVALVAPLGVAFWRAAAPVRPHIEQAGLIPQLETLAATFTSRDFVIVESRNASDTHVLAVPLAYIYDRTVAVLANPRPDKQRVELLLDWAAKRFDRVFFLGGGGTDLLSRHIAATPTKSWQFSVPEYDTPINAYPSGVTLKEFDFGLYQLTRTGEQAEAPMDLTLGTLDELNVVRFHSKERNADGQTFRWTRDVSYVILTSAGGSTSEVTIWMSNGGRPAAAPPADVEVALEDQVLGTVQVDDEMRPYRFTIAPGLAASAFNGLDPIRLRLRTTTWQPSAILGGPDGRDLGVIVTRVQTR